MLVTHFLLFKNVAQMMQCSPNAWRHVTMNQTVYIKMEQQEQNVQQIIPPIKIPTFYKYFNFWQSTEFIKGNGQKIPFNFSYKRILSEYLFEAIFNPIYIKSKTNKCLWFLTISCINNFLKNSCLGSWFIHQSWNKNTQYLVVNFKGYNYIIKGKRSTNYSLLSNINTGLFEHFRVSWLEVYRKWILNSL